MRRIVIHWLGAALIVILGTGTPARAEMVNATLDSTGFLNPSAPVMINLGKGNAPYIDYTPGVVNWTNNTKDSSLSATFTTFCIELTQDISPGGTYPYNLVALQYAPKPGSKQSGGNQGMGLEKANKIAQLWEADYGLIGTSGTNAAAFQLAIWKIEYDYTNLNFSSANGWFSSGNFQAGVDPNESSADQALTKTALAQATSWLGSIWNDTTTPLAPGLMALDNPYHQDQVTQLATPIPPTIFLAVAGLAVGAVARWRKMRTVVGSA